MEKSKTIYILLVLLMISMCACNNSNINPIPPPTEKNPYDGLMYLELENLLTPDSTCEKICKKQAKNYDCWDYNAIFINEIKRCECSIVYCKKQVPEQK